MSDVFNLQYGYLTGSERSSAQLWSPTLVCGTKKPQNLGNAVFLTPKAEGIGVKTQLFFAYHLTLSIHKLQVILPAYITYIQMRNAILGKDSVHKTGKGVKLKINQTSKKIKCKQLQLGRC